MNNFFKNVASLTFASQIIMVEALGEMINELVNLLGGWEN